MKSPLNWNLTEKFRDKNYSLGYWLASLGSLNRVELGFDAVVGMAKPKSGLG